MEAAADAVDGLEDEAGSKRLVEVNFFGAVPKFGAEMEDFFCKKWSSFQLGRKMRGYLLHRHHLRGRGRIRHEKR